MPLRAAARLSRSPLPPALLLLTALACGHARTPTFTGPEEGGPPWVEVRSPHFVIRSDMPIADVRLLIADYERIYGALEDLVFAGVQVPAIRTSVLALRRGAEFSALGMGGVKAVYIRRFYNDDERIPALIVEGRHNGPAARLLLQHELTHRFLYHYLPGAPAWFGEGFAIYVSTMSFERKGVKLGRTLPQLFFRDDHSWDAVGPRWRAVVSAPISAIPTVAGLLRSGPGEFRLRYHNPLFREEDARRVFAYHAGAWSLVHVLRHAREAYWAALQRYTEALSAGATPEHAWARSFGALPPGQLEADYQAFLRRRETPFFMYPDYQPRAAEIEVEGTVPPAHVHLLWAALMPWRSKSVIERARREIAIANALAPDDPEVLLWRARLARRDGRLDLAAHALRLALKLSPDDERALLERFEVEQELVARQPPASRDYTDLDARVPELLRHAASAGSLHAVARYLEQRQRHAEALPAAESAVAVDYACFPCLDTLAALYARAGRRELAYRTQLRALNVLPDGARDDQVLAHLEQYRQALAAQSQH